MGGRGTNLGARVTVGRPPVRVSAGIIKHGVLLFNPKPGFKVSTCYHVLVTLTSSVGRVRFQVVHDGFTHHQDVVSSSERVPGNLDDL